MPAHHDPPRDDTVTLPDSLSGRVPCEPGPPLVVGSEVAGYRVLSVLGQGGMGLVYEAQNPRTGARVALKTLRWMGPAARERLKREFRELAAVRHPNLVPMYELRDTPEALFFTMEVVHGTDLLSHLRQRRAGPERLRDAFRQLADGLGALHREGLLHLDLKPGNVMVGDDDRVRVLDFGLVQPMNADPAGEHRLVGTPAYMAPELLEGAPPTPAADWYSVGVMLHEALYGERPAPQRSCEAATAAPDLEALCRSLLDPDPGSRADGCTVARALGGEVSTRDTLAGGIVGRGRELRALRTALEAVQRGETCWVAMRGESGVGKTTVLDSFLAEARATQGVQVLTGACYERESVPYQGMDTVVAELVPQLVGLPLPDAARADVQVASHVFPSLSALCPPPAVDAVPADLQEYRRVVFRAVKSLFELASEHHAVVLAIDDVQWGDVDGARLLGELLCTPTPGRLLVVTTSRDATTEAGTFLEELRSELVLRGTAATQDSLEVARLSEPRMRELLAALAPGLDEDRTTRIMEAAQGLPFLLNALALHASREGAADLESLVAHWTGELPEGALVTLQAVALSAEPVPQRVALRLWGDGRRAAETLASLRHAALVRTCGDSPDGPLEVYHALIGSAVRASMPAGEQRARRLALADALAATPDSHDGQIADLYHQAGENGPATEFARRAAESAERALAFEAAAHWYGRALAWSGSDDAALLVARARCLEYSGRGADAAREYELAARSDPEEGDRWLQAAGAAWFSSGHVEQGIRVLSPLLKRRGLRIERSGAWALFRASRLLLRIWRRGLELGEPAPAQRRELRERAELGWSAAVGLGVVLPVHSLPLHVQSLLDALAAGELVPAARSMAMISAALTGGPLESLAERLSQQAEVLASRTDDPYLRGAMGAFGALDAQTRWKNPLRIRELAEDGLKALRSTPRATTWEEDVAEGLAIRSRLHTGEFDALDERARRWLAEARGREDLFAHVMAAQFCTCRTLCQGDLEETRRMATEPLERWENVGVTVQHFHTVRILVYCHLYEGAWQAAADELYGHWERFERAQMHRTGISRVEVQYLRGVVCANLATLTGSSWHRREATRSAKALARIPGLVPRAHAAAIGASLASTADTVRARRLQAEALEGYEAAGFLLYAACARLRLARLSGDVAAIDHAVGILRDMGVTEPRRYVRVHSPELAPPPGP